MPHGRLHLDDRLSAEEGTRRFAFDGRGQEAYDEGYYGIAIRRRACRDWVFRFTSNDRSAHSILEELNRAAREAV
jgi:hypothetical protein